MLLLLSHVCVLCVHCVYCVCVYACVCLAVCQIRLVAAAPLVRSSYRWFTDVKAFCAAVDQTAGVAMYQEGVVYSPTAMVLVRCCCLNSHCQRCFLTAKLS